MTQQQNKPEKKDRRVWGRSNPVFYWFWRYLCGWALRLVYWTKLENADRLPKKGKIIICGNHLSMMDPVLLVILLKRRISFMAKKSLFGHFGVGWFLPRMGAFPVDRTGVSVSAVRTAISVLDDGGALGIFPEGTRSKNGALGRAFDGIGMIAAKSKAPILPAAIITKHQKPKPFTRTVVRFGTLIETPADAVDGKQEYALMTSEAMRQIAEMLEQGQ